MRCVGVSSALAATLAFLTYADTTHAATGDVAAEKKDLYLEQKRARALPDEERERWQRALDERVGEKPDKLINIRNLWTRDVLAVPRDPELGEAVDPQLVNRFLRCRFTDRAADMDERLLGVLIRAAEQFDADRVEVVSGYRSEKHNVNLRKKGSRVARNSQHTHGTAVDFRIPGVHVARLHRWARSLRLGGVGYYPRSGFVHVDTADVRFWTVR